MHLAHRLLGVALAAALLTPALAPAQERERDRDRDRGRYREGESDPDAFHWDGRIPEGNWIRIRNLNGEITVEGTSGDRVEVRAEKHWKRGDPEDVRFEVVRDGDNVTICALWFENSECDADSYRTRGNQEHRDNDVSVTFAVRLPRGVKVLAGTVNGSVDVSGARAQVGANTVNGRVEVATSTGPVEAHTVNGALHVRMDELRDDGDLEFATVNGSVTVEGPPTLDADVEMSTVNGSVRSDYPLTVSGRFSPRNLHGTIGRGGRHLSLKTVNGSIELRKL
jgi:hypothetical protein